jgi:hypothetical protein
MTSNLSASLNRRDDYPPCEQENNKRPHPVFALNVCLLDRVSPRFNRSLFPEPIPDCELLNAHSHIVHSFVTPAHACRVEHTGVVEPTSSSSKQIASMQTQLQPHRGIASTRTHHPSHLEPTFSSEILSALHLPLKPSLQPARRVLEVCTS